MMESTVIPETYKPSTFLSHATNLADVDPDDTHNMYEFEIDTKGIEGSSWEDIVDKNGHAKWESDEEECSLNHVPLDDYTESDSIREKKKNSKGAAFSLDNTYLVTNYVKEGIDNNNKKSHIDKVLEKSCLGPGLEKLLAVPVKKSKRALKRERKAIRDKTKGSDWYNLPAPEVTEEVKNDLEILKMRSALDSKSFYKKNDITVTPKYFQIGRVIEGPADFYNGRIPKSQRKKTLVDELLADSQFRAYQKKKYKEIVDDNRRRRKPRVQRDAFQRRNSNKRKRKQDRHSK